MGGGIGRQQAKDMASQKMVRQDLGGFLTDGGIWSWDVVANELSWNAAIRVRRAGGIGSSVIAIGSVSAVNSVGDCVYVVLNRDASGGPYTMLTAAIDAAAVNKDDVFVIGIRGSDGRLYLRDGTIFGSGESKILGTLSSETDRTEDVGDGTAGPFSTVFTYVPASEQLAVFVGGILQKLGTHYTETGGGTTVTFAVGFEPGIGEFITFVNIVGGEGPPGVAGGVNDLQGAYDGGRTVDTDGLGAMRLQATLGTADVLHCGTPGTPDAFQVMASGDALLGETNFFRNPASGELWAIRIENSDFIIYNLTTEKATRFPREGGIEHGDWVFPGPFSSGGGVLQWTEFNGTFSNSGPTTIPTGLAGADIRGVLLEAFNGSTTRNQYVEMSLGSAANRSVYVSRDSGSSDIVLSGNTTGSTVVGSNLQNQAYSLIVFHE